MVRLFRRLSLPLKVFVVFAFLFVITATLYISVMYVSYKKGENLKLSSFIPQGANAVFVGGNISSEIDSPFIKAIRNGLFADKIVRAEFSRALNSIGLPSLDEIEDRRFRRRIFGEIPEETTLEMVSSGLVVGACIGNNLKDTKIVAVVRVPFRIFLAIPLVKVFARVFSKGLGIEGEYLVINRGQKIYIKNYRNILLGSNDIKLIEDAFSRGGIERENYKKFPVNLEFRLEDGGMISQGIKEGISYFPVTELSNFIDFSGLEGISLGVSSDDKKLLVSMRLQGASLLSNHIENYSQLAGLLPANTFFVEVYPGKIENLWQVIGSRFSKTVQPKRQVRPFSEVILENLMDFYMELEKLGIRSNMFANFYPYSLIAIGSETPRTAMPKSNVVPAVGFIIKVKDGQRVLDVLKNVSAKLVAGLEPQCFMTETNYSGFFIRHLVRKVDPFQLDDLLLPSYVIIDDVLVMSNSLPFIQRVIDTHNAVAFRSDLIKDELSKGKYNGALTLDFSGLMTTICGLWMMIADLDVNSVENRQRIYLEKEKELSALKQTHPDFEEIVQNAVKEEIAREISDSVTNVRKAVKFMEYIERFSVVVNKVEGGLLVDCVLKMK